MAARFEYKSLFLNRGVIAWLDNESARYAASKGSAQAPTLTAMARMMQQLEVQYPTVLWVERVCSYSNPSDKPSRGQCDAAAKLFGATYKEEKVMLGEETIKSVAALSKDLLLVIRDLWALYKRSCRKDKYLEAFSQSGGNTPRKMGTLQQVWPIQQLPWIRQTRKIPMNTAVRRHRQASAEISPSVTPLQRTDWDPQHVEQKESGRIVQSSIFISDMSSAVFALCLRVRIYMEYLVQFLLIPWRAVVTRESWNCQWGGGTVPLFVTKDGRVSGCASAWVWPSLQAI